MATKKTSRKTTARSTAKKTTARKTTAKKTAKKATAKKATKKKAAKKSSSAAAGSRAKRKPAAGQEGGLYPGLCRVQRDIGGRALILETGRMAKLASGSVFAQYAGTTVLATAQSASNDRDDIDFLPLTVDYREKAAAAGKFPGGFFKREGRPTTREILTCRIIDRSIRPLFADGYRRETQVLTQVLSTDRENDSDVVAAVAAFAALAISDVPNGKTLGACRIGLRAGELVINPSWSDLNSPENELNLTISAHEDAIVMVEAGAKQLAENVILEALELGHEVCTEIAGMIDELKEMVGKPDVEFRVAERNPALDREIAKQFGKPLRAAAVAGANKQERSEAKRAVKSEVKEAFAAPDGLSEKETHKHDKYVTMVCDELVKQGERDSILSGQRADGRGPEDIRQLSIEVGVLPQVHGSALFTRGETQALCTATLGTIEDKQILDGIYPADHRRWLLHYAFPPFSVGEVRRFLAPGRREIGHGALAERAIEVVLPSSEKFAYSLRVTSEILESNGSSSMASVCGATLALMDAGVPIEQPVAGIAMGLVVEDDQIAILSDILGSEDHCGDMDFKVAGTGRGITALQMDIKCEGLERETLEEALAQARRGRLHILREMLKVIREPRSEVSPNAPRLVTIEIPVDKIGAVIGPGGRIIRGMQEEFDVRIAVGEAGSVEVCGLDAKKVEGCLERIREMTAEVEIGQVYKGRVSGVKEFGAFVELLPGQEGLVHVSELSNTFIRSVTDVVQIGDEIEVKVIDIDDFGKVKLSRRVLLPPAEDGREPDRGRDRPRGRGRDDDEGRPGRGRGRYDRPRDEADEARPPRSGRGREIEDEDRPPRRGRGRGRDRDDERPARSRDDERPARSRDDERPGRGRDAGDRPPRGRGRDRDREFARDQDEDRPPRRGWDRGRERGREPARDEDDDRPPRGRDRGRDSAGERPARGPDRGRGRGRGRSRDDFEEERAPRGHGRGWDEDDDRPRRGRDRGHGRGARDDDDRPPRSRDDDDRPRGRGRGRGPGPGRDDDDRPRGRGAKLEEDVELRPARDPWTGDDDEDAPRGRGRASRGRPRSEGATAERGDVDPAEPDRSEDGGAGSAPPPAGDQLEFVGFADDEPKPEREGRRRRRRPTQR